jgi:integrase
LDHTGRKDEDAAAASRASCSADIGDTHGAEGNDRWLRLAVSVRRTVIRPISENTLDAALRRLGYGPEAMTAHGFRAMAATRLNEMGRWHPDVIERQLAHQEQNDVRRAYTHGVEYWPDRVLMMQVWAGYLDELTSAEKVISLREAV